MSNYNPKQHKWGFTCDLLHVGVSRPPLAASALMCLQAHLSLACTCIMHASQVNLFLNILNKQMNASDSITLVQAVEALDQVRQQVQERIAEQGLLAQRPGRRVQKQKAKHSQALR